MKNLLKKIVGIMFWTLLMVSVVPTPKMEVQAAPSYKQLYRQYLSSHIRYNEKFYILNVDRKGVPELITSSGGIGLSEYNVFTIKKGAVVRIGEFGCKGGNAYLHYVKKYKGLYASGWTNGMGGSWGNLYCISKGKLTLKYHAREAHNPKSVYYCGKNDRSAKKVSKSYYIKYVRKYMRNVKKYKMKDNTATNRNKI